MSFTLNEEFQLRKATLADYTAVFSKFETKVLSQNLSPDINKNVYEGNDYLPEIYEQWIQDINRDNFVVLSGDEASGAKN